MRRFESYRGRFADLHVCGSADPTRAAVPQIVPQDRKRLALTKAKLDSEVIPMRSVSSVQAKKDD